MRASGRSPPVGAAQRPARSFLHVSRSLERGEPSRESNEFACAQAFGNGAARSPRTAWRRRPGAVAMRVRRDASKLDRDRRAQPQEIAAGRAVNCQSGGVFFFGIDPRKSSSGADMGMLHLRMAQAACDCLNDDILPELARAVRCIIVQAGPSIEIRNGARSSIGIP